MRYYRVVDSSFLYKVEGEESAPPSLKDCVKCVLGKDMPKTHDSVSDSRMAMELLHTHMAAGGRQTAAITRPPKRGSENCGGDTNGPETLFVHRIPKGTSAEYVKKMFINHCSFMPSKMGELAFGPDFGKVVVHFPSAALADACFEALRGAPKLDKGGREQKQVFVKKTGEGMFVRRNEKGKKAA